MPVSLSHTQTAYIVLAPPEDLRLTPPPECSICCGVFWFFFHVQSSQKHSWIPYSLLMHEGQLFISQPGGERKTDSKEGGKFYRVCNS